MMLHDKRTPTCSNCGMAKLETEDIVDTSTNYEDNIFIEYSVGVCPNCGRTFSYTQRYSLVPLDYDDLVDITEDEEDEDE